MYLKTIVVSLLLLAAVSPSFAVPPPAGRKQGLAGFFEEVAKGVDEMIDSLAADLSKERVSRTRVSNHAQESSSSAASESESKEEESDSTSASTTSEVKSKAEEDFVLQDGWDFSLDEKDLDIVEPIPSHGSQEEEIIEFEKDLIGNSSRSAEAFPDSEETVVFVSKDSADHLATPSALFAEEDSLIFDKEDEYYMVENPLSSSQGDDVPFDEESITSRSNAAVSNLRREPTPLATTPPSLLTELELPQLNRR